MKKNCTQNMYYLLCVRFYDLPKTNVCWFWGRSLFVVVHYLLKSSKHWTRSIIQCFLPNSILDSGSRASNVDTVVMRKSSGGDAHARINRGAKTWDLEASTPWPRDLIGCVQQTQHVEIFLLDDLSRSSNQTFRFRKITASAHSTFESAERSH
jgi:hypothetical protein